MKKAWGVLVLVFVGAILLRLAWDALQPLVPVILIVGIIVLIIIFLHRPIARLFSRRSRF